MNKQEWKIYYRLLRIVRRESLKVTLDCIVYGTGCMRINEKGEPEHIPYEATKND